MNKTTHGTEKQPVYCPFSRVSLVRIIASVAIHFATRLEGEKERLEHSISNTEIHNDIQVFKWPCS